ncbi:MAG: phospholipase D-like domain-containing protein [Archaeoglobaceae archaeon]
MKFRHKSFLLPILLLFTLSLSGFACGSANASGQIIELCPDPYGDYRAEYIKAICSEGSECYLTDGEGRIEFVGSITAARDSSAYSTAFGSPPDKEFSSGFALANSGETVSLFEDGELVDSFNYGEDIEFLDKGVIYFRDSRDGWDFRYQDWSDLESIEDNVSGRIIVSPADYTVDAEEDIKVASYTLTDYRFSQLAEEGVDVEVFLDATPVGGVPLEEIEAIRDLEAHFLDAGSYQNFHYKFAVIDNQRVVLTTENWKWDKRGYIVEVESGKAADLFHEVLVHDIKYEGDRGGTGNIEGGSGESYPSSESQFNFKGKVRFFVLPDSNPIFDHISGASNRVYIQVPYMDFKWFNGTPLLDSIVSAAEKGAEVRILLDSKYNTERNQKTADFLNRLAEKRGLDMKAKVMEHMPLHAKVVVADDNTLITSANFNRYGLKLNREAGAIIYDDEATQFMAQQFEHDWEGGQQMNTNFIIPAILILSASIIVTYKALKK